jgi:hypothetical protein
MASLALLPGCSALGDFGRPRPSVVHDDIHAWMGPAAARTGPVLPWKHNLTDEERRLRDLAYPLIEPPYDRNRWYSVLNEYGFGGQTWTHAERDAYAVRLLKTPYRSQTARYNKLIEDIRNDVVRLDPFFAVARYVADMDRKRRQALEHVTTPGPEARAKALHRITENACVIQWVQESLQERALSYKIALEQLVIAAPSPNAVEAERALTLLQQRIASYIA